MTVVELAKTHKWNLPTSCPICGSSLSISDNHTKIRCDNEACKSKLIGRLKKWVEKMNIMELAPVTLEKFVDAGFVSCIEDLYHLPYDKIANMEGFGARSAEIYKKNIESARHAKLAQYISGFNIDDIGEKIVQRIIDNILATHSISELTVMDLLKMNASEFVCDGVGQITAEKFTAGLKALSADIMDTMDSVEVEPEKKRAAGGLSGKSFCFTGAMSMPRATLEKMVEDNGGEVKSSVSKNLTYLVQQDPSSMSTKSRKARDLGVTIISPDQFLEMVK